MNGTTDLTRVQYSPILLTEGDGDSIKTYTHYSQFELECVDALHHYFVDDNNYEVSPADDPGDADFHKSHAFVIAELVLDRYIKEGKIARSAWLEVEPQWQDIRNNASFIAGGFTQDYIRSIVKHLKQFRQGNMIILDASGYLGDATEGAEPDPFNQLMYLANHTKDVIEEGLIKRYHNNSRKLMQFLNAPGGSEAPLEDLAPDEDYAEDQQFPSKWIVEGRFLAKELVEIKPFKNNFDTLVILNAHRYITSDQLNLTKFYRLFAKLGRINTRIVFVG